MKCKQIRLYELNPTVTTFRERGTRLLRNSRKIGI
jgi:hypothetical protein